MTAIPEATLAREAGLHYAGVSLVTNLGAGISPTPLDHSEVEEAMAEARHTPSWHFSRKPCASFRRASRPSGRVWRWSKRCSDYQATTADVFCPDCRRVLVKLADYELAIDAHGPEAAGGGFVPATRGTAMFLLLDGLLNLFFAGFHRIKARRLCKAILPDHPKSLVCAAWPLRSATPLDLVDGALDEAPAERLRPGVREVVGVHVEERGEVVHFPFDAVHVLAQVPDDGVRRQVVAPDEVRDPA